MEFKILQIDKQMEIDLKSIRNHLGSNCRNREQHMFYSVLTMLINRLNNKTSELSKKCPECKLDNIHYSMKNNNYICQSCEYEWEIDFIN